MICNLGNGDIQRVRYISEIPCLIISFISLAVAWSVGNDFQTLIKSHEVIGEERSFFYGDANSFNLPIRNGLKPGDVGYDGYDLHLFDGVFDELPIAPTPAVSPMHSPISTKTKHYVSKSNEEITSFQLLDFDGDIAFGVDEPSDKSINRDVQSL